MKTKKSGGLVARERNEILVAMLPLSPLPICLSSVSMGKVKLEIERGTMRAF